MSASPSNAAPPSAPLLAERGVITNLFPSEDYGLLRTEDGRELSFQRQNVDGEFDRLNLGSEVRFTEQLTESGPEAIDVVLAT
jgi:hypothetical protein